jgi:hypothetical protein
MSYLTTFILKIDYAASNGRVIVNDELEKNVEDSSLGLLQDNVPVRKEKSHKIIFIYL